MSLREFILREIAENGPVPFSRYMELCLYHPEWGFYARPGERFGKTGDYYTASDVHAVFGRLLARQFHQMWQALGQPERLDLVELGPGRGLFARDVLDWSAGKFPEFFRALRYRLVEQSSHLRDRLREWLREYVTSGRASVETELAEFDDSAIVFANEFFDALPVEVVDWRGQVRVGAEGERLVERFVPASPEALEFLDSYGVHPEEGERVEATLQAVRWMRDGAARIRRGFLLVIDYGYTRDELLAGRHRGTVTAMRSHTVSDSPYEAPGEQDITAHVNFTALRAAGHAEGLDLRGHVTQAQFLIGIGEENEFADAFEGIRSPQEHTKVALQLKHLVTPAGMGETFHVLVMGKGVGEPELSGMRFAR